MMPFQLTKTLTASSSLSSRSTSDTFLTHRTRLVSATLSFSRKQAVSSQNQELEALEARLRETEERLREKQSGSTGRNGNNTPHRRQPLGNTFDIRNTTTQNSPVATQPASGNPTTRIDSDQRPSPATMGYWKPQMPGTLPDTPGDSRQNSYLGHERSNV